jgi:hypothetical protein
MKYILSLFILFFSTAFSGGFLENQESEHLPAEFWQRADGKYCVQIIEFDSWGNSIKTHIYIFDHLSHSDECPCSWLDDYACHLYPTLVAEILPSAVIVPVPFPCATR